MLLLFVVALALYTYTLLHLSPLRIDIYMQLLFPQLCTIRCRTTRVLPP